MRELHTDKKRQPRSTLELLDLLNKDRQDFEQVADDAIVGNVESGSFGIVVDGHDGLRVLHPHQVLNRARDTDGDVEFGSHSLTRRTYLSIDWKPLRIADRSRRGQVAAESFGKFFGQRDVVFTLD